MNLKSEVLHWEQVGYPDYKGLDKAEYIAGKIEDSGCSEQLGYSDTPNGFTALQCDVARILNSLDK